MRAAATEQQAQKVGQNAIKDTLNALALIESGVLRKQA